MSIRPEEAAAEASRFSLRSAILGMSDRAGPASKPTSPTQQQLATASSRLNTQLNPMNSKLMTNARASLQSGQFRAATAIPIQMTMQMPVPAPAPVPAPTQATIQSSALTFGSIVGSNNVHQLKTNAPNQHSIQAMNKIAEFQRASVCNHAPVAPVNSASTSGALAQRVLKPGYVNGGTVKTESSAELMRLAALVDSLNSKVSSQAERLHKTESSLIRANNAISTERASHNARFVRMQADLKSRKDSEIKLRTYVGELEAISSQKLQKISFEDAANQAEQFDQKLSNIETQLCKMAEEKNLLANELTKARAMADDAVSVLSTERASFSELIKAEKDAVASTAAAAEAKMVDLRQQVNEVEGERDLLSRHLETHKEHATAQIQDLEVQCKAAAEEAASAKVSAAEIAETRDRVQSQIKLSAHLRCQLNEANQTLAALQDAKALQSTDMMFFEDDAVDENSAPSDTANCEPNRVLYGGHHNDRNRKISYRRRSALEAKIAASTSMQPSIARAGPANDMALIITGATSASMDAKVSSLVKSVSMDITDACAHHRRQYLQAMQIPDEEIEKEMNELMNAPADP